MFERVEKAWGYEELLHNYQYCMKLLVYTKPISSSLHYHQAKNETFYVASGDFEIEWGNPAALNKRRFSVGDRINFEPGTPHRVRCLVPGVIVEASTPDNPADCVRLIKSET